MVIAWTGDELSRVQAEKGVNFNFEVKGQGQSPPQIIGIWTKVCHTYGPKLVILAWTALELSRGQASDWPTGGQKDTGNKTTQRLELASGKDVLSPFQWRDKIVITCQNTGNLTRCATDSLS